MVSRLFHRGAVISRIKDQDLRNERIRLEMEQDRSFKKIEESETSKASLFKEMLGYSDRARQEAVANRISTYDTQVRLEQAAIRAVGRQLKLMYTVETIKRFQRRNFRSPLVNRLLGAKLDEVNKTLLDVVSTSQGIDEMSRELLNAVGFAVPESDKEVQDLIKLAQQVRDQMPQDADAAAETLRQQWNKQKGLDDAQPA